MEKLGNEIPVSFTDPDLNALLSAVNPNQRTVTAHFNQSEEFYLSLEEPVEVPHLSIHHDVRNPVPDEGYLEKVSSVVEQVVDRAPGVLTGLTYLFDPTDILRPAFFRLYRLKDRHYLYIVRLDLKLRPRSAEVIARGTNDVTSRYASRHLHLDPLFIPLAGVNTDAGKIRGFRILQTVSQTWIGERGRGYFVQGIWMDDDLTKFFSKLFLPADRRYYPFYPFLCKYRTICMSAVDLTAEARKTTLPALRRALSFLLPRMARIQESLRDASFDEKLPVYQALRKLVPEAWAEVWKGIEVRMYLNQEDMKEFEVARVPG